MCMTVGLRIAFRQHLTAHLMGVTDMTVTGGNTKPLTRFDRDWRPKPGDCATYAYIGGYWQESDDFTDEDAWDEAAFERWEDARREKIAERNEY